MSPQRLSILVPALAAALGLASIPATAQFSWCSTATSCIAQGHTTFAAMPYPQTEDITLPGTVTLTGPSSKWTMLQSGCSDLNGYDLNGSLPFNALLRAQSSITATTAATGARYEVQLIVDGLEYGWYNRRLRGAYPQTDVFEATAQGLSAGSHKFLVQARLVDAGTITIAQTYMTAQGSPTTFPGAQSVNLTSININTSGYAPLTNTITFTNSQAVDLAVQGYFSVDAGSPGHLLVVAPYLDGVIQQTTSGVAVPQILDAGINVLAAIPNVPPGTHTLALYVSTTGSSTTFSAREVEFVSFPATSYGLLISSTGVNTFIDSATNGAQPTVLATSCGLWTKLLEGTIPPDAGSYNQVYEGYIRMVPPLTGQRYSELSFETLFPVAGTDGGGHDFEVTNGSDGVFLFGDSSAFGTNQTETLRLWTRKVNAYCDGTGHNGQQGSFWVGDRWMWVRHVPINGCLYH